MDCETDPDFHNTKQCLYGINHFLFFGVQYLRTALSIASRRLVPAGREQAAMLFSCLEKAAVAFFHSISWISMASGFCVGTSKYGTMDFKICVFLVWIRSSYVMDLFSSMDNTSYIIFYYL